jgi:inorganic pyrophosphatase
MLIDKISVGKNPPEEINVIVEIPMNSSSPVKYEFDKESGAIFVDRIMQAAMYYPCNYGFVPHTLSGDGDPVDVLVASSTPFIPGSVVKCRPVAVLMMEDESGFDEKILAVPISKLDSAWDNVKSINDVSESLKDRITHFFENYKKLEKGKWVKVVGWEDEAKAKEFILDGIKRLEQTS